MTKTLSGKKCKMKNKPTKMKTMKRGKHTTRGNLVMCFLACELFLHVTYFCNFRSKLDIKVIYF